MTQMPEVQPFRVVEENLRCAMRFYGAAPEHGENTEFPGLQLVSSGINFGPFNAAMITSPCGETDLVMRLKHAAQHFSTRKLRWSCWVCDDFLAEDIRRRARRIFADQGLFPLTEPPGMLAEAITPTTRWLPELECRRVCDPATRTAFCDITSTVFDVPFSVSQRVYDREEAWRLGLTGWVGYLQGRPIASTATILAAGAIGVYSVATLPRFRRHGYAESLMRHALQAAMQETGIHCSVLQTTRSGLKMYQQMGYRIVTRFSVYIVG